jgi:hypothetical protein
LFRNLGNGQFAVVTDRAGTAFQASDVGRGAAFGDIDNDGDVDVLVGNDAGRTQLLINNVGTRKHWLGLRLVGEHTSRDMYGARVAVLRANGPTLWRRARADGSYASANDPRVLVGLGDSAEPPRVRVVWPSGREGIWPSTLIGLSALKEGSARREAAGKAFVVVFVFCRTISGCPSRGQQLLPAARPIRAKPARPLRERIRR